MTLEILTPVGLYPSTIVDGVAENADWKMRHQVSTLGIMLDEYA